MPWAEHIRGDRRVRIPVHYIDPEPEEVYDMVEDEPAEAPERSTQNPEGGDDTSPPVYDEQEKYLRLAADFDNFRRRTAENSDRENARAKREFILDLLEVADDFDRALEQGERGLEPIHRNLAALLRKHGVERIETLGETFDPELHEAVMVERDPTMPEGLVSRELRSGYFLNDDLLRPARVAVNKE